MKKPWVRGRRRKALGLSLLLMAVIGMALVYLWFSRLRYKSQVAHAGPGPAALCLCGRNLGGAAVDVAAVYKPG
jgi:hypothetical protein